GCLLRKRARLPHPRCGRVLRGLGPARAVVEAWAAARTRDGLQGTPPAADPVRTSLPQRGPVNDQIAHMAGVSMNTAKHYHAVQVHGSADLKEAVDQGEVAISDAAGVARQHPPEEQTKALALVRRRFSKPPLNPRRDRPGI